MLPGLLNTASFVKQTNVHRTVRSSRPRTAKHFAGVRLKGAAYDGPATQAYSETEPMVETVMLSTCTSGCDMAVWGPGEVCIAEPPSEFIASLGVELKVGFLMARLEPHILQCFSAKL